MLLPRQFYARPFKDVIDRREYLVLACGERPYRNLKPSIRIWMNPEALSVDLELRPNAHAVNDQHGVLHRRVERESAAV